MVRLIQLSGPACVGKGPLIQAVKRFHPNIDVRVINVTKSFESRPGGLRPTDNPNDFRQASEIQSWSGNPQYIVGECRELPQAIDLEQIRQIVRKESKGDLLLYLEAYYTLGQQLRNSSFLANTQGLETTTVFLSPLSRLEIEDSKQAGVNVAEYLTHLMMNKLLVRARAMDQQIDKRTIEDFWSRAKDAVNELGAAHLFSGVLVNHDGEGSPNWHYDYDQKDFVREPEGEAARTLQSFSEILRGGAPHFDTKWTPPVF